MNEQLLLSKYNIVVKSAEKAAAGAGSDTYFINSSTGKYVVKFPCTSEINNPENEPDLCQYLLENNIKACEFVRNIDGRSISYDASGRLFNVQKFIDGTMYEWNTAPQWLLDASAETLGRIHSVLKSYKGLPEGIGKNFFKYMTPQSALSSYEKSVSIARHNGDSETCSELEYRMEQMRHFPSYAIDITNLTCQATHGDYFISQLICGEKAINAVIDWTTACVHPVVWEIMRSYVYAAACCADGTIDIQQFIEYVKSYLKFGSLNKNDIAIMPKLFYYQIAVCDYYAQYYNSAADNKDIYLSQAILSTKLMKWFEKNIDALTAILVNAFPL